MNGLWRIHLVSAHFSPLNTGAPACTDSGSSWFELLQYSK